MVLVSGVDFVGAIKEYREKRQREEGGEWERGKEKGECGEKD
jgi:hypothetical protein